MVESLPIVLLCEDPKACPKVWRKFQNAEPLLGGNKKALAAARRSHDPTAAAEIRVCPIPSTACSMMVAQGVECWFGLRRF